MGPIEGFLAYVLFIIGCYALVSFMLYKMGNDEVAS